MAEMKAALLTSLCLALASVLPARANDGKDIVLAAQADHFGFHAHERLVIGQKSLEVSLNSNFLCQDTERAFLGKATAPLDQDWKLNQAELVQVRLRSAHPQSPGNRPHETAMSIGNHAVSKKDAYRRTLERVFESLCDSRPRPEGWKIVQGIEVSLVSSSGETNLRIARYSKNAATPEVQVKPLKEARCGKVRDQRVRCTIPGEGEAFLKVPAAKK